MIPILTYLWGEKFDHYDVAKLAAGLRRHLKQSHRLVVVCDRRIPDGDYSIRLIPDEDRHLLKVRGCFVRLRLFDPQWQLGLLEGKERRLVSIDLDSIITGPMDEVFDRPEPFLIMQGGNATNPCPFNGALMLLRSGFHRDVWADFSLDAVKRIPFHSFPDDQGWIWHKLPGAAGWKCGHESGLYVYQKPGWPGGKTETRLPEGARLVTFINKTPRDVEHLDWVQEFWR